MRLLIRNCNLFCYFSVFSAEQKIICSYAVNVRLLFQISGLHIELCPGISGRLQQYDFFFLICLFVCFFINVMYVLLCFNMNII